MAGCAVMRGPDLTHRSEIATLHSPGRPVVLIHGFLGSKLRDPRSHKVAWGDMASIMFGGDTDLLALPLDADHDETAPGLEAYQIYDQIWGVDYYSKIIDSLGSGGGYRFGDIDNPAPGENAFVFVYDWRRDLVESAARLGRALERLRARLGPPDLRFDLVAHSQGGLIARYFIKYGSIDVLDENEPEPTFAGASFVDKVIMLGTPNRGCLESLKVLHLGVKKVFRPMRPEVVFTMPSVYQLLPPEESILFATPEGKPVDLGLYDPQTWVDEGWSAFSRDAQKRLLRKLGAQKLAARNQEMKEFLALQLQRSARLHRVLDRPGMPETVAYHALGSDCVSTLKTAIVAERRGAKDGGARRDLVFDEQGIQQQEGSAASRILFGPGDGKVLMRSLLALPEAAGAVDFQSAFFVCENHGLLTGNPVFQNNLLYLLLRREGERSGS